MESGAIKQRVALLDREALGLDVMVYVHVRLSSQGRDALAQFEKAIRDRPEVLDCCTLTGEWDFHLRIVTHDMKVAFKIADRVAMLFQGQIIEQGTPFEFQQSRNPIVQQFIEGRADGPLTEGD